MKARREDVFGFVVVVLLGVWTCLWAVAAIV